MIMTLPGRSAILAALLSAALAFTAVPAAMAQDTHTVNADNGAIEVPVDPQRVVTIGSATTPYIDTGGKMVGATELSASLFEKLTAEQQAAYRAATIVGTNVGDVDLEKLASLKPDLILMYLHQADYDQIGRQLQAIAPTVFFDLRTDWDVAAAGMAEASNMMDSFNGQKRQVEQKIARIRDVYAGVIATKTFANANRWPSIEPGMFAIDKRGCPEIAEAELGMDFPALPDNATFEMRSFEQIGELSAYDVILYPVDIAGEVQISFLPMVETNAWKALPAVKEGRALGVFCVTNSSYGAIWRYLDSLDSALATLSAAE